MVINIDVISAFLSGSLATLVIREILNQINRKIDFSRELKKIVYQKKLEKAENAVAYYWTYLNKAVEVKKSIETINKALSEIDETELDVEIVLDTLSKNSKTLEDLAGHKYFSINAVHLYFDLEDDDSWSEEDTGKLYDCIAEMKYRDNDIKFWMSLYNAHAENDEQIASNYWEEMKKVLPAYQASLQKFVNLLEKNKQATHLIVRKIKSQI